MSNNRLFTRIVESFLTDNSPVYDLILEDEGRYLATFPCISQEAALQLQDAMMSNAIGVYNA